MSSAPGTTMRRKSGSASRVWWISRVTRHCLACLLLSEDDQDNDHDSATRPLVVVWDVQTTLPGPVYGKKCRSV